MTELDAAHDGVFVVFEGIDGAGTSTQAELYGGYLRAKRRLVHLTREPSQGPIGSLIRMVLSQRLLLPPTHHSETMALLFAADRLDHDQVEIAPHLRDGAVVLSDRYDLSSLAYQSATTAEEDVAGTVAWIRELNRHALRPAATVVLDVSPEVAATRRRLRGGALELFDDSELQAKLADAYRHAERLVPEDNVLHIDGDASVEEVHRAIVEALSAIVEPAP
jgi:dTMP kinase